MSPLTRIRPPLDFVGRPSVMPERMSRAWIVAIAIIVAAIGAAWGWL